MKKKYIIPTVEVIHLNLVSQLAVASVGVDGSTEVVDPGQNNGADQDGRDDIPSSPNIWDQQW